MKFLVGDAFAEILRVYRANAGPLLMNAIVVFLPITLLAEVVSQQSLAAGTGISLAFSGSAAYLFSGLIAPLVAEAGEGERLWLGVAPVAGSLVLAGLIYTVATSIGVMALIVPGLFLMTIWAVAPAVMRLEGGSAAAAFRRSRALVRGNGWRVFGLLILLILVVLIGSALLQALALALFGEDTGTFIGSWLGVVVAAPLLGLMPTVAYLRLGGGETFEPDSDGVVERQEDGDEIGDTGTDRAQP